MANYFQQLNEAFDKKFGLNGLVESKRKLKEANTDWYSMEWDDQVNAIKRFVKNYRGSKVFEDFAASVGADVDEVVDAFADLEAFGIIDIPKKIQIDDKYRNDDIYESKRKLREAKNDGIFSMTLSEYANSQGVDEKEAESWVTMHPEKTISKLYFSEDEESPYTGVVYTDGTISVVGLRYDADVKDFSTMRKVLLGGSEHIDESKRNLQEAEEGGAKDFLDNLSSNLLLDLYDFIFEDVYEAAEDLGSLPDYLPMTAEKATKDFVDAVKKLAEAAFIKYCVDKRDDEAFDEGVVKTLAQPIRDAADTVRDVLNIPDKNTKLDEDKGSLGNEIDRYQKWVDFDMSRYGKISERTQQMVNKAGYQILKDDHGDYEVAAGHFE